MLHDRVHSKIILKSYNDVHLVCLIMISYTLLPLTGHHVSEVND